MPVLLCNYQLRSWLFSPVSLSKVWKQNSGYIMMKQNILHFVTSAWSCILSSVYAGLQGRKVVQSKSR